MKSRGIFFITMIVPLLLTSCAHISGMDETILELTKAIEQNPKDTNALKNRGMAYYDIGNYDLAISDFTKGIEIDPKDDEFYCMRADSYYSKKDWDKAWADVHKVESFGESYDTKFIEKLKKASGRGS